MPVAGSGRAVALFTFLAELLVIGDFALGAEEILGEIGVDAGLLGGDLAADAEKGDGDEEAVDVLWGGESAGGLGEFGGGELLVGRAGISLGLVRPAEGRAVDGKHAAAMAMGFGEGAAIGIGGEETKVHFGTPWGIPLVFVDL